MRLTSYSGTCNLGDAIQTLAMIRLIGEPEGFADRDTACPGAGLIVNGFLGGLWRAGDADAIFCGVHCASVQAIERLVKMRPAKVGTRDPWTAGELLRRGLRAEFVGCSTLTLPRYDGPRSGELTGPDVCPLIPRETPWTDQLELAADRLEALKTAAFVRTSRLHVALPCLAMGTPVELIAVACTARFGVYREALRLGAPVLARRFREFLKQAGVDLLEG